MKKKQVEPKRSFKRITDEEQVAILQRMERQRDSLVEALEEVNAIIMSLGG